MTNQTHVFCQAQLKPQLNQAKGLFSVDPATRLPPMKVYFLSDNTSQWSNKWTEIYLNMPYNPPPTLSVRIGGSFLACLAFKAGTELGTAQPLRKYLYLIFPLKYKFEMFKAF